MSYWALDSKNIQRRAVLLLPYIAWVMFGDCMRFINYPWRGRRLA
jgi:tryptophan-rich sensory protein